MTTAPSSDRRIRRTRSAIRDAFVELVLAKPYDEITVNEIIGNADIGRSTFYQHYKSKDDILAKSLEGPMSILAGSVLTGADSKAVALILVHFWEKRSFARIIFSGSSFKQVKRVLSDYIEVHFEARGKSLEKRIPSAIAAQMIAEAQMTLLVTWLTGQAKCSLTDVVVAFVSCSQAMFNDLAAKKPA